MILLGVGAVPPFDENRTFMLISRIAAALLATCLAWPISANAQDFSIPIKKDDGWSAMLITLRGSGKIGIVVKPVSHQGRIGICGFVLLDSTTMDRYVHDIVQNTRIRLGRQQLLPNPDYLPIVVLRDGKIRFPDKAGCTLTRVTATPELMRQKLTIESRGGTIPDW